MMASPLAWLAIPLASVIAPVLVTSTTPLAVIPFCAPIVLTVRPPADASARFTEPVFAASVATLLAALPSVKLAPAPLSERLAAEIASVPFPPCETTPPAVSVTALPLAVIPPLMVKPVVSVKLTEFVPALADKLPTALAPVSVIASGRRQIQRGRRDRARALGYRRVVGEVQQAAVAGAEARRERRHRIVRIRQGELATGARERQCGRDDRSGLCDASCRAQCQARTGAAEREPIINGDAAAPAGDARAMPALKVTVPALVA